MDNIKKDLHVLIISFLVLGLISIFFSNANIANSVTQISTISVMIADSSDDAEDRGIYNYLASSDLEFLSDGSVNQEVGMRFNNIRIPQGSVISKASIQFTVDEIDSEETNIRFYGEAIDDAPTFGTAGGNILDRGKTDVFVSWDNVPEWSTVGESGPEQKTPDLSPIIQEIISRPGWVEGNSIVIIANGTGERTAESYNGSPTNAPLLEIDFLRDVDTEAPSVPSDFSVEPISYARINLSWSNSTDNISVSGYNIYRCQDSNCNPSLLIDTTDKNYYNDVNLSPNTTYVYVVASFDDSENTSELSSSVSATTLESGDVAFYTFIGAGDIAKSGSPTSGAGLTSNILGDVILRDPDTIIFTTGDNVYDTGTLAEFFEKYAPTWGKYRSRTFPSPGNHDHRTAGASGYLNYFCPSSEDCVFPSDTPQLYYSYDIGNWRIISLDSDVDYQAGSTQIEWLKQDLATIPEESCILAYFHHPYYSSGSHGSSTKSTEFWKELYKAGADVVVSGHDHTYERFAKQDTNGNLDTNGIRNFVAGIGGGGVYDFNSPLPNSEVRYNDSYGVIKFKLRDNSYDWELISTGESTFTDVGSNLCNNKKPLIEQQVSSRISHNNDDAEDRGIYNYLDSTDLEFLSDGSVDQEVGMRFNNINIPQGSVISKASIQFTVDEIDSEETNIRFYGEAIDDAPTFGTAGGNILDRGKTDVFVSWDNVPEWSTVGESGPEQKTPDLSPIIQEIISRPGWVEGNSIVIIANGTGERTAESYNGSPTNAPLLEIDFSETDNLHISNVQIKNISTTEATITWATNELSDARINYGETTLLGNSKTSSILTVSHTITLTGLTPDTNYLFEAQSDTSENSTTDNKNGEYYSFTTEKEFIYVSDIILIGTIFENDTEKYCTAKASIEIKNQNGENITDFIVNGTWKNSTETTSGTNELNTSNLCGDFTFTIDSVAKDGYIYNPTHNLKTSEFISF